MGIKNLCRFPLCNGRKFNGLLMRIKIRCGSVNYQCLLVKVYGSRKYPIPRFAETNETGCKSSSTNTITTAITTTTTKAATTTKNATKTIKPLSLNPPDDDKNLVIVIATVASVATLIIIILLICICRRAGHKQKDVQDNIDDSTEQQNNHTGQSTYSEAQKSDAYAKFTDEYTTIIFKSSPKADGPKPQYSELGLEYQDIKPVYSELSGEHQTNIDEPFYREVDEPDGGEFPQPSDAIYHTVEEQTSSYEENNYYSAVETLPDELSSPTPVYAKVKK